MTVILSLDLGTKTGWAVSAKGQVYSGTESFQNDRFSGGGMKFLRFINFLHDLNERMATIEEVYFEEVRNHKGVDAAHAYGGFMAHLTAWCEQHAIPYQGVPVGTIKKFATGRGNANKSAMMEAVKQWGHTPTDDNEADALALLYWRLKRL